MTPLDVLEAGRAAAHPAPIRVDRLPASPRTFVWGRHFETGIALVDDQHRRLVDLINRLADAFVVDAPESTHTVHAVFDRLVEYAREHFGDEENLMRNESLFPEYIDHHCRVHRDFSTQLDLLWASRNAMGEAREVFLGFLVAWLGFHILGEDHVMAMQIDAIRGGTRPDAAYQRVRARDDLDRGTHALIDAVQSLYHALSLQNHALVEANIRLEERVSERTRELDASNSALRVAYRNMENLARTDGLLAIANRRHFEERLELEWQRALRERQPLAMLLVDVDYFKRFNDYYGHQAGDSCLRAIADTIVQNKRSIDLLARYGGEELVMLLPNTSLAGAQRLARIACAGVEHAAITHAASPVSDHVTVSIGVASLVPDGGGPSGDLIAAADRALYDAKQSGRNRIAVATDY